MFKKVDKSLFEGLPQETDPAKRFNVEYPEDGDSFAAAVWKDVIAYCKFGKRNEAYKVMFLDGENSLDRKWFFMSPKQFDYLKCWNKHCEERVENGVSFRDSWDIHWWIVRVMPEVLKLLREGLHGYPTCSIDLWNKLAEITGDEKIDEAAISAELAKKSDGKKITLTPAEVKKLAVSADDESFSKLDDFRFNAWKKSLERLEFLFRECNDDACTMKNPHKFEWHFGSKPCGHGLSELVWTGTDDERAEHDKYMDCAMEIEKYQSECLHKAMKILEVFIEYLWD